MAAAYARGVHDVRHAMPRSERHAPLYGQDTDYVLRDLLGYSADEVRALEDAHVTARQP